MKISLTTPNNSPVDRFLDCFHYWGIMINGTVNICVQTFVWTYVSNTLGYVPRS